MSSRSRCRLPTPPRSKRCVPPPIAPWDSSPGSDTSWPATCAVSTSRSRRFVSGSTFTGPSSWCSAIRKSILSMIWPVSRWAYPDPGSTSGYMVPLLELQEAGVEPGATVEAGGHPQAALAVYRGDADFGTTFYSPPLLPEGDWEEGDEPDIPEDMLSECAVTPDDQLWCGDYRVLDARASARAEAPDIVQQVRILSITQGIPNDTALVRPRLPGRHSGPDRGGPGRLRRDPGVGGIDRQPGLLRLDGDQPGRGRRVRRSPDHRRPGRHQPRQHLEESLELPASHLKPKSSTLTPLLESMSALDHMLRVENLTKVYDDGTVALRDVSFEVPDGQFLAIIGLSGSGKSTLLRCLNRLVEPTSGRILWNGEEVTAATQEDLRLIRRRIGMVFQHFNLVHRSKVITNVLGRAARLRQPGPGDHQPLSPCRRRQGHGAVRPGRSDREGGGPGR